jgi:hypothetical protein
MLSTGRPPPVILLLVSRALVAIDEQSVLLPALNGIVIFLLEQHRVFEPLSNNFLALRFGFG